MHVLDALLVRVAHGDVEQLHLLDVVIQKIMLFASQRERLRPLALALDFLPRVVELDDVGLRFRHVRRRQMRHTAVGDAVVFVERHVVDATWLVICFHFFL